MNASRTLIAISTNTQLGETEITPAQVNEVTNIAEYSSYQGVKFSSKANKENLNRELAIDNLLKENKYIIGKKIEEIGRTTIIEYYIDVGDAKPVHQKSYNLSQKQIEILNK